MRRQILPAILAFLALTVVTGVVYPLVITGAAQVAFGERADGSLIERDGRVVGSRLIGQNFSGKKYFHPRLSAAGDGYDAASSSASNLGPTNPDLLNAVSERVQAYRMLNGLAANAKVPIDAVTSSGSGLDPEISPQNARLQAPRVANVRGMPLDQLLELVAEYTDGRSLGFLGEPGVNVLELNLALDATGS